MGFIATKRLGAEVVAMTSVTNFEPATSSRCSFGAKGPKGSGRRGYWSARSGAVCGEAGLL